MKKHPKKDHLKETKAMLENARAELASSTSYNVKLTLFVKSLKDLFPKKQGRYGSDEDIDQQDLFAHVVDLIAYKRMNEGQMSKLADENSKLWDLVRVYAKDPRIEKEVLTDEQRFEMNRLRN